MSDNKLNQNSSSNHRENGGHNSRKNSTSTVSLIATIIVAMAAIVLAIVAIFTIQKGNESQPENPQSSSVTEFQPSEELITECTYAAHDLVAQSYSVLRLFVTEGLAHYDEPYGNLPADGIYTVNSTEYTSLEQIDELVRSVFIDAEADRIMKNIDGSGMAVYKNREVFVDIVYTTEPDPDSETAEERPLYTKQTVLGINADFTADPTKAEGWSECSIAVVPRSENECGLTIYLGGISADADSEANADSILETSMVLTGSGWKLTEFVY